MTLVYCRLYALRKIWAATLNLKTYTNTLKLKLIGESGGNTTKTLCKHIKGAPKMYKMQGKLKYRFKNNYNIN